MPFQLREFMVKGWKRHRDVPTTIDQLVDRAVEDLEVRRQDLTTRMRKNKIKIEPLEKIENLLRCCFEVAENLPDGCGAPIQKLKHKLQNMKQHADTVDASYCNTQMRFLTLRKKGRLGIGRKATANWQFAMREASNVDDEVNKYGITHQSTSETDVNMADMYRSSDGPDLNEQTHLTESQLEEAVEESENTDQWVECVKCSKWRILPRGMSTETLPDDWTCSSGGTWRSTGLTCDVAEDVDADDVNVDDVLLDVADCHQPLVGAFMVRRVSVILKPEEETWLLYEWDLRPCCTWNDGYSLYRCAAANRGTTKQQMLCDLLHFWGYKWQDDSDDAAQAPYENKEYEYVHDCGTEHETVTTLAFTQEMALKNIKAVRLVQDALMRGTSDRLSRRYDPPDEFFESLVAVDKIIVLFIDAMAAGNATRYKVYCRDRCLVTNNVDQVSQLLRAARDESIKIRGIAYANTQYCALYPRNEQPNFAGTSAIGQFA